MNEGSLKRTEIARNENQIPSVKKHHGTFFDADVDIEKQAAAFESELLSQTSLAAECVRIEVAEINRLFDKQMSERTSEPGYEKDLISYIEKIRFLVELSHVLKRIQPCCEVVQSGILAYMEKALSKIRLLYGCDLNDPETWKLAHSATHQISRDATHFDISRMKLSKLYRPIYDDMEWFVMSYRDSDPANKEKFFHQLKEEPQLLAWIQPWIELAERKKINWQAALSRSIESVSQSEVVAEKRFV